MKNIKKVLSVVMALSCGVTALAGCNQKETPEEKAKTLYVCSINKGYGIDWLKALLEKYCADMCAIPPIVIFAVFRDTIMSSFSEIRTRCAVSTARAICCSSGKKWVYCAGN